MSLTIGLQVGPGQRRRTSRARVGDVIGLGRVVHVIAGVDGEHGEAGGDGGVDVLGGLEVVGVRAEPLAPALLEDAPGGGVHHLLGGAAGALHLADGLLREEGPQARAAHRATCAGVAIPSRSPNPTDVSSPTTCGPVQGRSLAQRHRVRVIEVAAQRLVLLLRLRDRDALAAEVSDQRGSRALLPHQAEALLRAAAGRGRSPRSRWR